MADPVVSTTIDKLVNYLKDHGETDSDSLLKALKINESTLSVWADALEDAHVVKIDYKFGKMFMSPAQTAEVKPQAKQAGKEGKIVESEIASIETVEHVRDLLLSNIYDSDNMPE
jgi:DNA-binding transcriptional ArsR family regulator